MTRVNPGTYDPQHGVVLGVNGELSQWIADCFREGYQGFGIDVGASDGISVNTTWALEKEFRWTIVSVEANPRFLPALRQMRTFVESCACSDHIGEAVFYINDENPEAFSSLVKPDMKRVVPKVGPEFEDSRPGKKWSKEVVRVSTVDVIMDKWQLPKLDILTIDTEGTELDVLKGCSLERWKPEVIVVEVWESESPIFDYLHRRQYVQKLKQGHNYMWVRR